MLQNRWKRSGKPWGLADVVGLEEPLAQQGTKFCLSENGINCLPFLRFVLTERKPRKVLEKPRF